MGGTFVTEIGNGGGGGGKGFNFVPKRWLMCIECCELIVEFLFESSLVSDVSIIKRLVILSGFILFLRLIIRSVFVGCGLDLTWHQEGQGRSGDCCGLFCGDFVGDHGVNRQRTVDR